MAEIKELPNSFEAVLIHPFTDWKEIYVIEDDHLRAIPITLKEPGSPIIWSVAIPKSVGIKSLSGNKNKIWVTFDRFLICFDISGKELYRHELTFDVGNYPHIAFFGNHLIVSTKQNAAIFTQRGEGSSGIAASIRICGASVTENQGES